MIKSKIDDYTISLQEQRCKIIVKYGDKSFEYSTRLFKRDGMRLFPKKLYRMICDDIKYANIYDRFFERFYEWDERGDC